MKKSSDVKWKQTGKFAATSNHGHKLLKTLPHTNEPIYNLFDKDGKFLGSTTDKADIDNLTKRIE